MTNAEVVARYLELSEQIAILNLERGKLKALLVPGRNAGVDKDIRVSVSVKTRIDMYLLRRYVTPQVITMCSTNQRYRTVQIVPKPKPTKIKPD